MKIAATSILEISWFLILMIFWIKINNMKNINEFWLWFYEHPYQLILL